MCWTLDAHNPDHLLPISTLGTFFILVLTSGYNNTLRISNKDGINLQITKIYPQYKSSQLRFASYVQVIF